MPSLEQVGVVRQLYNPHDDAPLMSASDVRGPFYIINAYAVTTRAGMNPGPRVVFTLRCRDDQETSEYAVGEGLQFVKVMLSPDESRNEAVGYFRNGGREPLGPAIFVPVKTRGGTYLAARTWTPAVEEEVRAALAGPAFDAPYQDVPGPSENDLEDLPF